MLRLRTFGRLDLTDTDGRPIRAVLAQPKRASLLVYLAAESAHSFVRRALILPLFWPESDESAARHSLSQTIYKLRQTLGHHVIEARGEEELRLAPDVLQSDIDRFRAASVARRWSDAVAIHEGEFLAGFHLPDAGEFERWVDTTRTSFRRSAAAAAWSLAEDQIARRAIEEAERSAITALGLDPGNERAACRVIRGLTDAGATATALRFHEMLRSNLATELGIDLSAESRAVAHSARAARPARPIEESDAAAPQRSTNTTSDTGSATRIESGRIDAHRVSASVRTRVIKPTSVILGVLALLLIGGAVASRTADVDRPIHSIAVLPLADLTADTAQGYLVEGLHSALIGELARIATIRVTPRASVVRLDTLGRPRSDIARELGVDALITGGVFRTGDTVRVHVELIRARPASYLWTGAFAAQLNDVMSLHREMARSIAAQVEARLTPRETTRLTLAFSTNPVAYDAWLRGSYHASRRRADDLKECVRYGEQATALDPQFAEAFVLLSECFSTMAFTNAVEPHEMFRKAKSAATRAISIDSDYGRAHWALGYALAHGEWDWTAAERSYRIALDLNPADDVAHGDLAWLLSWLGRFDEALEHARLAEQLNPLSPQAALRLGMVFHLARRNEEAVAQAQRAIRLDPNFMFAYDRLKWAYHGLGRYREALQAAEQAALIGGPDDVRRRAFLGHSYGFVGERTKARAILEELLQREKESYVPPTSIAAVYLGLDEREHALDWLELAARRRDGDMVLLRSFSLWDPLREEPRFNAVLGRMRFP